MLAGRAYGQIIVEEGKAELTRPCCGNQWKGRAEVQPIKTEASNFIYRNPRPTSPDMPIERIEPGHIRSVWKLSDRERDYIAHQGANIELDMFAEPIPPVWLNVTGEAPIWAMTVIVAEPFVGQDGRWYVRMVTEGGMSLIVSKRYRRKWSARRAQRRLKRILPALEILPS